MIISIQNWWIRTSNGGANEPETSFNNQPYEMYERIMEKVRGWVEIPLSDGLHRRV
jgi:hypothetical protein